VRWVSRADNLTTICEPTGNNILITTVSEDLLPLKTNFLETVKEIIEIILFIVTFVT
jgi:hypothetical protein